MPKRSTGCEKCRQRKVKCDEARPHCRRCTNYGVKCPGYRPQVTKDVQSSEQSDHGLSHPEHDYLSTYSLAAPVSQNEANGYISRSRSVGAATTPRAKSQSKKVLDHTKLTALIIDMASPCQRDEALTAEYPYQAQFPETGSLSSLLGVAVADLCIDEMALASDYGHNQSNVSTRTEQLLLMLVKRSVDPGLSTVEKRKSLAAIEILAMGELFDDTQLGRQNTRLRLGPKATELVRRDGQSTLPARLAWYALNKVRCCSASMGLLKRKALPFAEQRWRAVTAAAAKHDSYIDIVDIMVQLPGLLERVDALASNKGAASPEFVAICNDTCWLRKELDDWLYWRHVVPGKQNYRDVDVREMETFVSATQYSLFGTVFDFASMQACSQYQLYWVGCLVLDCALLSLCRRFGSGYAGSFVQLSDFTERTEETIRKSCRESASSLCRSLPYCCKSGTQMLGPCEGLLLMVVRAYFDESSQLVESEWCAEMQKFMDSSSFSIPISQLLTNSQETQPQYRRGEEPQTASDPGALLQNLPGDTLRPPEHKHFANSYPSLSYPSAQRLLGPSHQTQLLQDSQQLPLWQEPNALGTFMSEPSERIEHFDPHVSEANLPSMNLSTSWPVDQAARMYQGPGPWDVAGENFGVSTYDVASMAAWWPATTQDLDESFLVSGRPVSDGVAYGQQMNVTMITEPQTMIEHWRY